MKLKSRILLDLVLAAIALLSASGGGGVMALTKDEILNPKDYRIEKDTMGEVKVHYKLNSNRKGHDGGSGSKLLNGK
jgi:hypothetical protein